jgi:hypothetical protein
MQLHVRQPFLSKFTNFLCCLEHLQIILLQDSSNILSSHSVKLLLTFIEKKLLVHFLLQHLSAPGHTASFMQDSVFQTIRDCEILIDGHSPAFISGKCTNFLKTTFDWLMSVILLGMQLTNILFLQEAHAAF